jgi:hypothetical protein
MLHDDEHVIHSFLEDTVKPATPNGQIPLGRIDANLTDLSARFQNGWLAGTILGIPVFVDTSLAAGKLKFTDSDGALVAEN